jgi:TnpA family transposase
MKKGLLRQINCRAIRSSEKSHHTRETKPVLRLPWHRDPRHTPHSPYVLDGLLEHQTELQPRQLMTDSAGYSDIIFGLFWLLGFQFSPRLAELGETRFWRIDHVTSRPEDQGDPNYRWHILNQLNRGEARGRISRKVFQAKRNFYHRRPLLP